MPQTLDDDLERLSRFIAARRLFVLTGAGCSTESGIPDYRGPSGTWRAKQPMLISEFVRSEENRRHYWARNFRGWPRFSAARPNPAHDALARLESHGVVTRLVTQNVDGLHQAAGSSAVTDLHGRADRVICMGCRETFSRHDFQRSLESLNGHFTPLESAIAPDSDAEIAREQTASFQVPFCPLCGGILKPDVVFFGESVPKERVNAAMTELENSAAMLVVGSSLAVWSGYRFAVAARTRGIPIAAVNQGWTRADEFIGLKIERRCGDVLPALVPATEQS
jgi:NAD-dependent SIR2 family protein deacetylase